MSAVPITDETIDIARRPDATHSPMVDSVPSDAPRQIRDYRLQDKLGEGGMGAVYKAVHERLEKRVALKILPGARMKDSRVVARFHRDIKPANMLLTRQGVVKLLDLGLARLHDDGPIAAGGELTHDGQRMGTVDYMAPEQAIESRSADIRADIYSLGCSLYKLLTGKPPFAGDGCQSAVQKLLAHTMTAPPALADLRPDLPPALSPIVERMMAKDRNARYSSPGELAEALAPFCAGADLTAAITNRSVGDQPSVIGGPVSVTSQLAPVSSVLPRISNRIPPRRRNVPLALAASLPFMKRPQGTLIFLTLSC